MLVVCSWVDQKRDPYGFLTLSKCQESLLGKWKRPKEFIKNPVLVDTSDGGMYLVQDIITDCSVIASLCSAAAWEYKGEGQPEVLNKEELKFENVKLTQRSYK